MYIFFLYLLKFLEIKTKIAIRFWNFPIFGKMENIICNPGFQHIGEKIFLTLKYEDLKVCQLINKKCINRNRIWIFDGCPRRPEVPGLPKPPPGGASEASMQL